MSLLRLPLFALSLVFCTGLLAQEKTYWKSGYYITTADELIKGQINDNFFNDRIRSIRFRKNKNAKAKTLELADITEFEVNDKRYEVHEVTFKDAPRNTADLITAENISLKTESGALRVFFDGQASLLQYVDQDGRPHYFARQAGGALTYLPYARIRDVTTTGGNSQVTTDNSWRSMLAKDFLYACNDIETTIRRTNYKQTELVKLFERYYKCTNVDPEYRIAKPKAIFEILPTVGLMVNQHDITPLSAFSERYTWDNPTVLSPVIGAQVRFRATERSPLAFKAGILYHTGSASDEAAAVTTAPATDLRRTYSYEESGLMTDLIGEYTFLRSGKINVAVDLGLRYDYQFRAMEVRTQDPVDGFPRQSRTFEREGAAAISPLLGVTATRDRINLSLRFGTQSFMYEPADDRILRIAVLGAYRL